MKYEVYSDADSQWRWTLLADNARKIANSGEGYRNYNDCLHTIELVKQSSDVPVAQRQGIGVPQSALLIAGALRNLNKFPTRSLLASALYDNTLLERS